jgi:hypothetical protein
MRFECRIPLFVMVCFLVACSGAQRQANTGSSASSGELEAAALPGSTWACQMDGGVTMLAFFDEWLVAEIEEELYWSQVDYDESQHSVRAIRGGGDVEGGWRIERVRNKLVMSGGGEQVECELTTVTLANVNDAPELELWETQQVFEVGDVWNGGYECAQGMTESRLQVREVGPGTVGARFYFEHQASGVSGSFDVRGRFDTEARTIFWSATDWVDRPEGYVTVDFDGRLIDDRLMQGHVVGPGCGKFEWRR